MRRTLALLLLAGTAHARPGGGQTYRSSSSSPSRSSSSSSSSHSSSSSYHPSSSSSSSSSSSHSYTPSSPSSSSSSSSHSYTPSMPSPSYTPSTTPYVPPPTVEEDHDGFNTAVTGFVIGVPVAMLGIVVVGAVRKKRNDFTIAELPEPDAPPKPTAAYDKLIARDPAFSPIAFEDFASRLFAAAHLASHSAESILAVAPYVAEKARAKLVGLAQGATVQSAVVGSVRLVECGAGNTNSILTLELEANVTTATHTSYTVETWVFQRLSSTPSKPPSHARTFACPHCGAPWQDAAMGTQQCAACNEIVDNGRFDWIVLQIDARSVDAPNLTDDPPERGNDFPTVVQDGAQDAWRALFADDPAAEQVFARTQLIYKQLNEAYAKNDLIDVRGVVSDGIYDYLRYWVHAYKRAGLRNQLDDMRITNMELAKVSADAYYRSITIRIFATGKDYVVDEHDQLVRGSRHRERAYTEYWTLIRSAAPKPPGSTTGCPSCGAPLAAINQAGTCGHCDAHVTAGEFDWVLSKIEQDDSYRG